MKKTIRQVADELGVSKTAIRKHMTDEFRAEYVETTTNHTILISEAGVEKLKTIGIGFQKPPQTAANQQVEISANQNSADIVAFLKAQLIEKDKQIAAMQQQLANQSAELAAEREHSRSEVEQLTAALTAAQALNAADKQQLLLLQSEQDEKNKSLWQRIFGKKSDTAEKSEGQKNGNINI